MLIEKDKSILRNKVLGGKGRHPTPQSKMAVLKG